MYAVFACIESTKGVQRARKVALRRSMYAVFACIESSDSSSAFSSRRLVPMTARRSTRVTLLLRQVFTTCA